MPDRQDSHGDWMIELVASVLVALSVGLFFGLFVYLWT